MGIAARWDKDLYDMCAPSGRELDVAEAQLLPKGSVLAVGALPMPMPKPVASAGPKTGSAFQMAAQGQHDERRSE